MTEFFTGDIVRVEMPRGYSVRGILGISLMFSTSAEAKFEGAIGTINEINPVGPHSVHQYLVDFRTHDNSRIGIPWQAQWFREEWLGLVERPALVGAAGSQSVPESTWPEKPVDSAGIAHPEAPLFTEGKRDFAPPDSSPEDTSGTIPEQAIGIAHPEARLFTEGISDFHPTQSGQDTEAVISGQGDGFVRVQGILNCPDGYQVKGNSASKTYLVPAAAGYSSLVPDMCFESEFAAQRSGYSAAE